MAIHEECGIFGIISKEEAAVSQYVYRGLYALQHRGQESCGIVVNDDGVFSAHKDLGLVGDVFSENVLNGFPKGRMAIGHVRYSTSGATTRENCQPLIVNHQKGKLAVAHNGNLTNALVLRDELELGGAIFHTTSDTETICYMITRERLLQDSIEKAVAQATARLEGAFSLVMMSSTKMIAVRDPYGFRPLCYGICPDGCVAVASESCALDTVNARFVRDISPGEMLVFSVLDDQIRMNSYRIGEKKQHSCIFEYIYFARPDSVIDGVSVHEARIKAGRILADDHPVSADVVIGVPDSGLDAALGYARESKIPYEIGLVKNKYVGRSFIAPSEGERVSAVRLKLSPVKSVIEGKRVVLVDDSIVRGTTSKRLIELLREAGASQIHLRISSPPFKHPCFFGVDIDSEEYLIANHHDPQQIAGLIGADSLGFLSLKGLKELACANGYCGACFDGKYPVLPPKDIRKDRFEQKLSERNA